MILEESMAVRSLRIAGVVALYWFVSIAMVFLNKHLLSNVECVVAVVFCAVAGWGRNWHGSLKHFPPFAPDFKTALQVLPLSVIFVAMIFFNNMCLKYVGVAFYNVGRSLTTVFNVLLTYVYLGQVTSLNALLMCAVIILGFFVGVDQEKSGGELTMAGIVYGVLASLSVALNAIFVGKTLDIVGGDMWRLTAYNNLNALLLFIPVMICLGESSKIAASEEIYSFNFWIMMTLAGIFGIAIGIVTMMQIKATSPLTHNISGTAKACAQTIMALQLSQQSKSVLWWFSNAMVLGGSMGYTMVRRGEMQAADRVKAADAATEQSQTGEPIAPHTNLPK